MSQPISFRQRLTRNTVASVVGNGWTMVLTLLQLPFVLRGLGAEAFGVWVLIQTFGATNGWLSIPATGLSISSTRQVALRVAGEDGERARPVAATLVVFASLGLIFGVLFAVGGPSVIERVLDLSPSGADGLRAACLAFGCQIVAENVFLASTSVLEGFQEVASARAIDAARRTGVAVAVSVASVTGGGLAGVSGASAVATALAAVLSGILLSSRDIALGRPQLSELRELLTYAGLVGVLTGTGVLHRTMDRTIAGLVFGPQAVAVVEIANQIQAGATAPMSAVTYPVLSAAPWLRAQDDDPAIRAMFERATRYAVLLTFPLVATAAVLAGPFVRIWVGDDFGEAIGLTQVALLYVAVVAPLQAGVNLLQGLGEAASIIRSNVVSILANLVASVVLVQVFGLVGLFVGTILGAATQVPILLRVLNGWSGHKAAWRTCGRAALRAMPPTAVTLFVGGGVVLAPLSDAVALIAGGFCSLAFGAVAAARWSLDPAEASELRRLIRASTRRTTKDS